MTQHRAPNRKRADVTQAFNDGMVAVQTVTDAAAPGLQPKESLREKVKLPYAERKLGIQRYYDAKQNQIEVVRVIRVPKPAQPPITSQDAAITEDGQTYRIDLVQTVPDVFPPCLDLTLKVYTQEVTP